MYGGRSICLQLDVAVNTVAIIWSCYVTSLPGQRLYAVPQGYLTGRWSTIVSYQPVTTTVRHDFLLSMINKTLDLS